MTVTAEDPTPQDVSFGCTVGDVLRLLPHVGLGAPLHTAVLGGGVLGEMVPGYDPADPYATPQVRRLTPEDVQAFIQSAGSGVLARIYRYEQVPERVREHIRVRARDLVATGAAHYTQAALHPASSGPNDGGAYADRLWQRFQTDLDEVKATIDEEIATPSPDPVGGGVSGAFPPALFPDEMRF